MSFVVLANFKSHKTSSEIKPWLDVVAPVVSMFQEKVKLLVAPSHAHLSLFPKMSELFLTAQDVSPFAPGAYTGAVNATQLQDLGVAYCIIGHSERRRYFHETNQDVANKARELLSVGITPAICLSEDDIIPQFAALDDELQSECLYCFEPPADIGGTVTAPLDVIHDKVEMIKKYTSAPILYGGSVNPDNIDSLLPLNLDGVLVATACLDPINLNKIITQASHAR